MVGLGRRSETPKEMLHRVMKDSSAQPLGHATSSILSEERLVNQIIRLLLEAARAEGSDPPTAKFVRSAKVIKRALQKAGDLSAASRRALADDDSETTPAVERYYDVLVRLVQWDQPLLEGQGNFGGMCYGHPDYPPAHPKYTECRITARGVQYLADV